MDHDMPARDAARFGLPGWRFYTERFNWGRKTGVAIESVGEAGKRKRYAVSVHSGARDFETAMDALKQWAASQ